MNRAAVRRRGRSDAQPQGICHACGDGRCLFPRSSRRAAEQGGTTAQGAGRVLAARRPAGRRPGGFADATLLLSAGREGDDGPIVCWSRRARRCAKLRRSSPAAFTATSARMNRRWAPTIPASCARDLHSPPSWADWTSRTGRCLRESTCKGQTTASHVSAIGPDPTGRLAPCTRSSRVCTRPASSSSSAAKAAVAIGLPWRTGNGAIRIPVDVYDQRDNNYTTGETRVRDALVVQVLALL